MTYYWTIRKIRDRFTPTKPGDIKVLSSDEYYSIKEIESKYEGWRVINMDIQPTRKEVKKNEPTQTE